MRLIGLAASAEQEGRTWLERDEAQRPLRPLRRDDSTSLASNFVLLKTDP